MTTFSSMDLAYATDRAGDIMRTLEAIAGAGIEELPPAHEFEDAIRMLTKLAERAAIIRRDSLKARRRIAFAKRAYERDQRRAAERITR